MEIRQIAFISELTPFPGFQWICNIFLFFILMTGCGDKNDIDHAEEAHENEVIPFSQEWHYQWQDKHPSEKDHLENTWKPYAPPESPFPKKAELILLKKHLPAHLPDRAALFIPRYSIFHPFELYCDGKLIHRSVPLSSGQAHKYLYIRWHLIPLPSDCSDKPLLFRFFVSKEKTIFATGIYLGAAHVLFDRFIIRDLPRTVLAFIFILTGAIAFLCFMFRIYAKNNAQLAALGTLSVAAGFYLLAADSNITLLFWDKPRVLSYLRFGALFLMIGGLWAFVDLLPGIGIRLVARFLWVFNVGCAFAMIFFEWISLAFYEYLFNISMFSAICGILVSQVRFVFQAIRGDRQASILCVGLSFFGITGAIDMILGLFEISLNALFYPTGLFLLLTSLVFILILRYQEEQQTAQAMLKESEEKYRRLFESAPIGILEADMSLSPRLVLKGNAEAKKMLCLLSETPENFRLDKVLLLKNWKGMEQTLRAGRVFSSESVACAFGGSEIPVRISASAMMPPALDHVIIGLEDITAEKTRQNEEEAITEERRRIAREIHDGLAQDLAFLRFRIGKWRRMIDKDPPGMHKEMDRVEDILSKNIREVRRSIFALRPVALDELGFFPALYRFAEDFKEYQNLYIILTISGDQEQLPRELEPVLFRIIQETVNNVAKHAAADSVSIKLDIGSDAIGLSVSDNGNGFDPAILPDALRNGHVGIRQMQERVASLGGTFKVISQITQGTLVEVTLPRIKGV